MSRRLNLLRKLPRRLLCGSVLLALSVGGDLAWAAQEGYLTDREVKIVTVVWGIVSYTRWPSEQGPLRVCVPEGNRHATLIGQTYREVRLGRKIVVRTTPPDATRMCDVVYFPPMPIAEAGRALQTFAGTPILTIGEGESFCSAGGMFCLLFGGQAGADDAGRFAVNLASISPRRSPLKINPQVLRLAKLVREETGQ
ncbi:MAG: YfiR family protein [Azoarcus sp.]|jgi:hypothetical protein|nr:YfiR family protein [Azoarcus sp.]